MYAHRKWIVLFAFCFAAVLCWERAFGRGQEDPALREHALELAKAHRAHTLKRRKELAKLPNEFDKLSLKISMSQKKVVSLGGQLPLDIVLENRTNTQIKGHSILRGLEIYMRAPASLDYKRFYPSGHSNSMIREPHLFQPGERVTSKLVLSRGWHKNVDMYPRSMVAAFKKPGRYSILAVLDSLDHNRAIASNILIIVVPEPKEAKK